MRVTFLTHYFPPEAGAPQTRIAELAALLQRDGIEVTVHTGFPHYPVGRVLAPYRTRPLLRETGPGGIRVVRSPIYPAANRGFARRLADHLSLCASALATAAASGRADVVVVETPPLFLAGAGVLYARAKRAALVLNVADLWPASAVALGALRSPAMRRAAERLEAWAYAHADAVAVPTEGIRRALDAHPAAAGRVERIGPAVDGARFAALPPPVRNGRLEVLYAGTIGLAQGVDTLVEAARLAGPATVGVTLAGGGAEAGRVVAAAVGAENVRLRGIVPAGHVPALYGAAQAGVVLLRDRPLFEGAVPTKLLECMAAGRAVVLAARGEAADLVRRTGAGVVVPPEDPAALAGALRDLAAAPGEVVAMGERGRRAVTGELDRAESARRWAALLARVAATRARPRGRRRRPPRPPRSSGGAAAG